MKAEASCRIRGAIAPLLILAVTSMTACASRVTVPPLVAADLPQLAAAGNFPDGLYRFEPGDTVAIRFPLHPEMDQEEFVRPDGNISVQLVGDVNVEGMTPQDLEQTLVAQTSSRLRDPQVEVSIVRFAEKNVYVTGEVGRPGLVPYRNDLTPLQAVIQAGGFRSTAQIDSVVLVRASGGEQMVSRRLNLSEVVNDGGGEPLRLAPHDVVYVPSTAIADADVWVDQHITRLFPFIRGLGAAFPGL